MINRLKRKWSFLLVCVLCMGVIAGFSGGASFAQNKVTLRLGHIFPMTHPVHKAAKIFADYVAEETDGKLVVEVHPGGALGKGNTLAENISLGTVAMGTAGPGLLMRLEPAWGLVAGEYVWESTDAMFKVLDGPVGDDIKNRLLRKKDMRVLGIGYLGKRHLTANKPVRKPEDIRGLKVRIPNIPLRSASFKAWGASPTPMAFSEVYLALKQGVVDCQENPFAQIVAMKFYEVQKYLVLTGHAINPEVLLMNEDKFQGLSEDYQDVLLEGGKVFAENSRRLFEDLRYEFLEKLLDEGMIVMKPDKEAFAEKVKEVPYKFENQWGEGLYDRVLEAQGK